MPATKLTIFENSAVVLLAYLETSTGSAATQSDISSITYAVYDSSDTATATSTGTIAVASAVFDTIQKSDIWNIDRVGYNFRYVMAGTNFPAGGKTYIVELKFTTSSSNVYYKVFEITTKEVYSS